MARETKHTEQNVAGPDNAGNGAQERQEVPPAESDAGRLLEETRTEVARYKDQLLRKAAEFENYKRRVETDWQNYQRAANEQLLLALLPIVDDLGRSLKSGAEQKNFDAFYQGVDLIHAKLLQTLKNVGVEPIESAGKPFNVGEHDALLQVPRKDVPPHTVLEEVLKGYRLFDRVLRHAKVVVSADQEQPASEEGTNG